MFLIRCYKHSIFHKMLISIPGMKKFWKVLVSGGCVINAGSTVISAKMACYSYLLNAGSAVISANMECYSYLVNAGSTVISTKGYLARSKEILT